MSGIIDTGNAPSARRSGQFGVLLAINALYVVFGAVLGTVQGGLPPVLRQQGYDIGSVGWIYAFYLPFGLAFLWAHYVDRVRLPLFGHRTGWIVTMQAVAVAAVLLIAFGSGWPVVLLAALGFTVTLAMATMDTALDALAVERIRPDKRPLASALKLAALSTGAVIGNGVFVVLFGRYGWAAPFLFLAGIMIVLLLPLLAMTEEASPATPGRVEKASLLRLLARREGRRRLLLVTAVSCVIFPIAGLNRIMLVDIGIPLEQIGWLMGTLGPASMLLVSFGSMPMMARFGLSATFLAFGAAGCLAVSLLSLASVFSDGSLAIAGSVLTGAAVSGIYVTVMAKILGWSAGDQPATDYAAYYGISRLSSTVLTIAAAQVAGHVAWSTFYTAGAVVLALVVLSANLILFRSEN